jgi:hypothetical protein
MEIWEKSETIPSDVRAHIESLVTALGGRSTYDDSYCERIPGGIVGRFADRIQRLVTKRRRS